MKVYYKNHFGETIDLKQYPYHLLSGDLLDYEWETISSGGRISGFGKEIVEIALKFEIFAKKEEYHRALDRVTEIFEKDILAVTPGKLYINDQYIQCYITSSKKTEWESDILAVTELTLVTDYPYWIKEETVHFEPISEEADNNKEYPYRYPYRYTNGFSNRTLYNDHYVASDFRMIIFGPVSAPAVFISEHLYQVNILLEAGEYLTIDSAKGTITVTENAGKQKNVFNNRNKIQDIFCKIPQGMNKVKWNGKFGFDIILLKERSQPKCG